MPTDRKDWPPSNGEDFIRSEQFALQVLKIIEELTGAYPNMDFADAAASLFTWLDGKVTLESGYINAQRFPTAEAFRAYLRQAAWNVARQTARQRRREAQISELAPGFEPVSPSVGAEVIAIFQECKDRLHPRLRRIYELWVQEDVPDAYHCDRLPYVTSILQTDDDSLNEQKVQALYSQACDALYSCVSGDGKLLNRPRRQRNR